jgi:hypothetical protein
MERLWKVAAGAAMVLLVAASGAQAAKAPAKKASAANAPASSGLQPARIAGKPNLNGIWQTLSGANWDLEPHSAQQAPAAPQLIGATGAVPAGLGVVKGGTIPYLPKAMEQREANRKGVPTNDPEAMCYLPGIPRATYMDHAFQVVQGGSDDMLFIYEYDSANRIIYMKKPEQPPIDTWMGTSYGQWEGDTLKITTLGQNGRTWLDRAGNYLTPTATVTERFTLKDHDHIAYEATIEDPEVYSKPWTISMVLYRKVEPNAQLLEFNCVPFSELLLYGDLLQGAPK